LKDRQTLLSLKIRFLIRKEIKSGHLTLNKPELIIDNILSFITFLCFNLVIGALCWQFLVHWTACSNPSSSTAFPSPCIKTAFTHHTVDPIQYSFQSADATCVKCVNRHDVIRCRTEILLFLCC